MTRLIGPDARVVFVTSGPNRGKAAAPGMSAPIYADEALTMAADILTVGGDAVPNSTFTVDSNSMLPLFQFPDGADTVWTSINNGPAVPLYARTDDRMDAIAAQLAGISIAVPAPTGVVATDTAAIQDALDAAADAGGGRVSLAAGQDYVITGVTIDSNVLLDANFGGLTRAAESATYLLATKDFDALVGGDSTGGPRDWGFVNGYLDGGKDQVGATNKHVLAIYGRRYELRNFVIRNGAGKGMFSKWSSSSPFLGPNGFESFATNFYIHSCDSDGLDFQGPHDAYFDTFFITKCAASASAAPFRLPDDSGRANGSNFSQFHIYGGNGYNYGAILNTSGCRISNFVVEGAQLGEVQVLASQIQLDGAHLYSGGIATATVKGIVIGDASHTGVNGLTIRAKIENCGGGGIDFTYAGDHNTIDAHVYYYTGTTPSLSTLGFVGTPARLNRIAMYVAGNDFLPTTHTLNQFVGPLKTARVSAGDTRYQVDLRDETNAIIFGVDHRGRFRLHGGSAPGVANGAQIGAGGSPSTAISGTDIAGTVTITTGASPAAGQLAAVTFTAGFGSTPRSVQLTPKDAAAAALQPFVTTANTAFSIRCAATPAGGTTYAFDYLVMPGA